jgi:hypothetical protein|eukprot:COSAG01_NODE_11176_length_1990_cov_1.029614_1_plen_75_part_00
MMPLRELAAAAHELMFPEETTQRSKMRAPQQLLAVAAALGVLSDGILLRSNRAARPQLAVTFVPDIDLANVREF